jgi:hypothetical protein
MREELDKKLCEDFPKIFKDRDGDMRFTLMCFGFCHGDGWYNIVRNMCYVIQFHIDQMPQDQQELCQVVAIQVKEKFGSLRFYYSGGDSYINGVVGMATLMSSVTCEQCGNPGTLNRGGWISCLCQACRENTGTRQFGEESDF